MASRPTFRNVSAATGAVLLAAGCARPKAEAANVFTSTRAVRVSIGGTGAKRPEATLGHVTVARLGDGGRHVVVLDVVAPFVKVFDGQGRFERAFLRSGDGPGETRFPTALAASGDTAILVGDAAGRLMMFGVDGQFRREIIQSRLRPLAATQGCDGDWIVYGPRYPGGHSPPTWLHRIRLRDGGETEIRDILPDSLVSDMLPMGVAYGLVTDGQRALAWHDLGAEPLLATWHCGEDTARLVRLKPSQRMERAEVRRRQSEVRMAIRPGMRARAGIATVPGGVVIAEVVFGTAGSEFTELTLRRKDGSEAKISVPGSFELRDSRPGVGVLMSATDPAPRVFLVSEGDLLALFSR